MLLFPSKGIMESMNSFFYKDIFLSMPQNFNLRSFQFPKSEPVSVKRCHTINIYDVLPWDLFSLTS